VFNIAFLLAVLPSHVVNFMYLFFYFLPKNSQAIIAQLQELKACERSTERITRTLHNLKIDSLRQVNKPHRKDS